MRRVIDEVKPLFIGIMLGLGVLALAATVTYAALTAKEAHQDVTRITRIVEGTPGPQGEPGVGVSRVVVRSEPPGSAPSASLSHGILVLHLPRGMVGPQGPRGEQGPRGQKGAAGDTGPTGKRGANGERGPQGEDGDPATDRQVRDAVVAFLRNHSLRCQATVNPTVFTCTFN